MKKIVFLCCCCFCLSFQHLNAQEQTAISHSSRIGLTYASFGEPDIIRPNELDGAASYFGDSFFLFGFSYAYQLCRQLEIETGIHYNRYQFTKHYMVVSDEVVSDRTINISLLTIPVELNYSFFRYFFLNAGVLVDMDIADNSSIDNQTGIGVLAGVGARYHFSKRLALELNPYVKVHSLIAFSFDDNHQRILEDGIQISLSYAFTHLISKQ